MIISVFLVGVFITVIITALKLDQMNCQLDAKSVHCRWIDNNYIRNLLNILQQPEKLVKKLYYHHCFMTSFPHPLPSPYNCTISIYLCTYPSTSQNLVPHPVDKITKSQSSHTLHQAPNGDS